MAGRLEVITGCMFSGKTNELIKRVRKLRADGFGVAVFAPLLDTRSPEAKIQSHDNEEIAATPISRPWEIVDHVSGEDEIVAIDETQFFDESIIDVCLNLVISGKNVLASGLDLDFRGMPFGPMPRLLACAEKVEKLWATCAIPDCSEQAHFSQRLVDGRPATFFEKVVLVGGADLYEPRCRKHHEIPAKPARTNRAVRQKNRENPEWQILDWAQQLRAIGENGLNFGASTFDRERYGEVIEISHEMIGAISEMEESGWKASSINNQRQVFPRDEGYITPKVAVAMAVFDSDDRILLVQRSDDKNWTLPGGWADVGYTPRENAERELYQETGLEARCGRIVNVYDVRLTSLFYTGWPTYTIVFYGHCTGGELTLHRQEVLDARYVSIPDLSELSIGSPAQIQDAIAVHENMNYTRYERPEATTKSGDE